MVAAPKASSWSPRNILLVAVVLAAIIGAATGYSTSVLTRSSPSPQTREFYLFARDLSFNTSLTTGITSDYIYSANVITINKGETLNVHFYNPTDENHTFTMLTPYTNDVVVVKQPTDTSPIHTATITIAANQAGIFSYHCRFHPPQMSGALVVQG